MRKREKKEGERKEGRKKGRKEKKGRKQEKRNKGRKEGSREGREGLLTCEMGKYQISYTYGFGKAQPPTLQEGICSHEGKKCLMESLS
jgi:hypothetical protein